MTFNVVTSGGRALGFFIVPPLEKGGEGGLEKANKNRRDMDLLIIYEISPDPSLLKRGTQLVPDIFIIPLWKKGAHFPPFFHHTIRYRAILSLTSPHPTVYHPK
jgi:hypothetical protein